jgi:3D (Asp-Asp-Asp) domain-containing protein
VIPLGTHFTVPGYGEAVAADVGSGVQGSTIDLWFPSIGQAQAWGRRIVTITLH